MKTPEAIHRITYCTDPDADGEQRYNIVNVYLRPETPFDLSQLRRHFYTSSSCGICGKASLEAIHVRNVPKIRAEWSVPASVIHGMGERLRAEQDVFEKTGGLHAAGWFSPEGELLAVREDVGRHNAVDKLLGYAFLERKCPLSDGILMVSGRASFEIMQKAAVAGVPMVVAVSAPSSLAREVAREFGITLIGFARDNRFNIYAGKERIRIPSSPAGRATPTAKGLTEVQHGMAKRFSRKWNPKSWVNLVPTGLGQVKPHHFREMLRAAWENRDQPGYAWRILRDGCCDGCALGTMGMKDWTLPGTHLCMVRLNLLRLNTMPAMDPALLEDVSRLGGKSGRELRSLGRLPIRWSAAGGKRGSAASPGMRRWIWRRERIRRTKPERIAFYLTSRGLTNEVYFAANKVARFLGTNHIDNAARLCHAPSTVALKKAIGYGATTISYSDWIGTDLLILVGTNLANNQPVATKYIYYAKKAGTRVIVVNPYKEEGLERYWIPSVTESALFGTRIMDEFFQIGTGGDAAFFNGALKHLVETGKVNEEFIRNHTAGFEEVRRFVSEIGWKELEKSAGTSREEMRRFAEIYARANSSVIVWSMGVTQHRNGTNNVLSIVNLALALGRIGKPHSGLCPIRGHSGVQGGAEMGAVPDSYGMDRPVDEETAKAIGELWGFPVPDRPGMKASSMIQAAHDGKLDVLYSIGGNFMETLPDPDFVREAIARVPLRIHQDIVLNPQMLVEPRDPQGTVLLLPGRTRTKRREASRRPPPNGG